MSVRTARVLDSVVFTMPNTPDLLQRAVVSLLVSLEEIQVERPQLQLIKKESRSPGRELLDSQYTCAQQPG